MVRYSHCAVVLMTQVSEETTTAALLVLVTRPVNLEQTEKESSDESHFKIVVKQYLCLYRTLPVRHATDKPIHSNYCPSVMKS